MLILCLSTTPSFFLSQFWIVTVCCLGEIQKADEHIETALGQLWFCISFYQFCVPLVMDDIYFVQLCFLQWLCRRGTAGHLWLINWWEDDLLCIWEEQTNVMKISYICVYSCIEHLGSHCMNSVVGSGHEMLVLKITLCLGRGRSSARVRYCHHLRKHHMTILQMYLQT